MDSIENYVNVLFKFRLRTREEVISRCSEKGFSNEKILETVKKMEENGLIDDLRFSKMYFEDGINLRKKGFFLLSLELKRLGVNDDTVADALNTVSEEISEKDVLLLDLKKGSIKDLNKWKNRMYRRGFSKEEIEKALTEFEEVIFD